MPEYLLAIKKDATQRLSEWGIDVINVNDWLFRYVLDKVDNQIKNNCNLSEIPAGLHHVAVDMVVGEILLELKTRPEGEELLGIDLSAVIKRIKEGDTDITFALGQGEGSMTPEQRLNVFISHLLNSGAQELAHYRCLQW